jgi:uncharacterized protein YlxP (DUF503 family)
MVIGVCRITVAIPESDWADTKRSVVKKIITRTRAQFNICMSEVDEADNPESAVLGFAAIGNDHCVVNAVIDRAVTFIEELYLAEVEDYSVEMIHM